MLKEKIISLPYNKYIKPRINTIKTPSQSMRRSLKCGAGIDFEINTGKCSKGNTWSVSIKNESH